MEKPRTMDEYKRWLQNEHKVEISERNSNYYYSVANAIMRDFETSGLWVDLLSGLREYDQEYSVITKGYALFPPSQSGLELARAPELQVKRFDRFLEKTYRKNVLENDVFPDTPPNGWILPENWFSRINDVVRTLFVVKYFDGVEFFIRKIESLCKKHKTELIIDFEAREEGYYAAHLYIRQDCEVPSEMWDTKKISAQIELQITTQVQEVMRKLLHTYYERKRMMAKESTEKWQWDYGCDEFCVNYLGHILHYVEGMIMEIRERQGKEI